MVPRTSEADFQKWLFSGESSFELSDSAIPRRQYVHRTIQEKYFRCCIQSATVLDRRRVMIWGAISASGRACFSIVNTNINSEAYIRILSENLIPYLDDLPLNDLRNIRFQQDNAPPHKSQRTRNFLNQHRIFVPEWPALSPDLNIIENIWALMKRDVRKQRPKILAALRLAIIVAWRRVVTPKLCAELYRSIPGRLEHVIKAKGARWK
jgi:transposase